MARTPCVWARCARAEHVDMMRGLAAMLAEDGDQIAIHTTLDDHPRGRRVARDFFDDIKPIMTLWVGGPLDGATLQASTDAGIPVILLDADKSTAASVTSRWLPGKSRATLAQLQSVFAQDNHTAHALIRAGADPDRTHTIGPLESPTRILPYSEDERREIAATLQTRPIWLARSVTLDDVPMLTKAQRAATARSHRLLLIVTPANPSDGITISEAFREQGFTVNTRSTGAEPEEAMQIHTADLPDEDGLWLRIAPVSFAGGSIGTGAKNDPFEAAALGSVVIHGQSLGRFDSRFNRLLRAGASFSISQPDRLGAAVVSLLSADRVASMATAGWDVTSSGAELSKQLVALIQERLDESVSP